MHAVCVVRALAAIDQFQPGTNLKAWLFTILRNQFYEQSRRRKREVNALQARFDESEAVDPQQDARAEITDLQQLIWRLPPLLREALILVGAQEMSHEEAAAAARRLYGPDPGLAVEQRVARHRAGSGEEDMTSWLADGVTR